jgi:hypothetical protein
MAELIRAAHGPPIAIYRRRETLLQFTIMYLVLAANIHEEWTPNQMIPMGWGIMLAYGVTWSISRLSDWHAKRKRRRIRQQERLQIEGRIQSVPQTLLPAWPLADDLPQVLQILPDGVHRGQAHCEVM